MQVSGPAVHRELPDAVREREYYQRAGARQRQLNRQSVTIPGYHGLAGTQFAETMPTHSDDSPRILRLAMPVPLRRLFDYRPSRNTDPSSLKPGIRLTAPFGRRKMTGILIDTATHSDWPDEKLKYADHPLDQDPVVTDDILQLCQWAATYYQHALGDTLSQALPVMLRQGYDLGKEAHTCWRPVLDVDPDILKGLGRAPRQGASWEIVKTHPEGVTEVALKALGVETATLKKLARKGLVETFSHMPEKRSFHSYDPILKTSELVLNHDQQQALEAITGDANQFSTILLHGVTGSGKTEVYLQAIHNRLKQQQQTLVLVPEIGLTPQTLERFRNRFNVPVTVLHSGLNDRERLNGWLSAFHGEAGIIIGTRSSIFTPMPDLGLIIVDEEHDLSYKQHDGIRYSARDLAVYRGKLRQVPVVLGSATPSLESLHNARKHRYRYQRLNQRAGNARLPDLELVDIRGKQLDAGLSETVVKAIHQTLQRGEQVLVFLNQRGYAPSLSCSQCGYLLDCPQCDAYLTLHRSPPHLHCHHCDLQCPIPLQCPYCNNRHLAPVGQGTERSEEALAKQFRNTRVLRIDRDSTRRKTALDDILAIIHKGEPAILVGTQMLAKGHHFPRVTLVVILNADSGFFSADFRGSEKMGQLLLQVAGRAGRSTRPGQVIIQTRFPENQQLQQLVTQGYDAFAESLLVQRQSIGLPPFACMALLMAEATRASDARQFLETVASHAQQMIQVHRLAGPMGVKILGPMPAAMEKRQGRYRMQLFLQGASRGPLHALLDHLVPAMEALPTARKIRWSVDVDPQEMS